MNVPEILKDGACWGFVILSLIEISPLKVNPWRAIGKTIAKMINGEVLERIATLDTEIKQLRDDVAEQAAISARARILRFGDEVMRGIRHTKDHFDQILRDIKVYDRYCKEHPEFENNVTEIVSARIKDVYAERLAKNDFL